MACAGSVVLERSRSSCLQNIFAKSTRTSPHTLPNQPLHAARARASSEQTAPNNARPARSLVQYAGTCVSSKRVGKKKHLHGSVTAAGTPSGPMEMHQFPLRPAKASTGQRLRPITNVLASNNSAHASSLWSQSRAYTSARHDRLFNLTPFLASNPLLLGNRSMPLNTWVTRHVTRAAPQ
jgi:hypothetical protein